MTRVVLDTNVLITGTSALTAEQVVSICSVTYAELEAGTRLAATGAERASRVRRLAMVRETYGEGLPFDDRASASFGILAELVAGSGRTHRSRMADLMIAATAHAHGAALVTHHTDDFVGLGSVVEILDAGRH